MLLGNLVKLFSLVALTAVQATDWCTLASCSGKKHIACNNTGTFNVSSTCASPVQVNLTAAQIQQFVDGHNSYRNKIATGSVSPFLPAVRMAKLTWDDQLATFAGLNTLQCKMQHDPCRNTEIFKFAGQNLATGGTTGTVTIQSAINSSLNMWYNENTNANMSDIIAVGTSSSGKPIGHFTAMMTARSTKFGCGVATYTSGKWSNYLVACDYASTNMDGWPVYVSGAVASGCTLGADETYPGLCTVDEPINANTKI